jgi:hypothetical protein
VPFPIDLALAPTAAFDSTPAHATLGQLVGSWRGSTQLWLEPNSPPEVTPAELHAEWVLGGRWLRLVQIGTALGKPHAGEMLLGFHKEPEEWQLAWIDSFHTGSAIMLLSGPPSEPGMVEVVGSYAAGAERWGWRTRLYAPLPEKLILESFNISPTARAEPARENRALLSSFTRV